ncbi:MAG: dienelactone hydrolase family protein [Gammaproteobacteria bacterium]
MSIFVYPEQTPQVKLETVGEDSNKHYRLHRLELTSYGINGQKDNLINADFQMSKLAGKNPLLIVLPLYGSYTYPSDEISAGVANHSDGGIHVLNILGEQFMWDWDALGQVSDPAQFRELMSQQAERIRVNVVDVSRIIDWAQTRPEIDTDRIAIIGFSHGALVASIATVSEPRIKTSIFVMGGANPHELIASCRLERTDTIRNMVQQRFGWDLEQYKEELEPIFAPYNVARYEGHVEPENVLIIDAYYDTCMPRTSRDALWEAMGRPERISYEYDHKVSFLSMTPLGFYNMRHIIYDFLDKELLPHTDTSSFLAKE